MNSEKSIYYVFSSIGDYEVQAVSKNNSQW